MTWLQISLCTTAETAQLLGELLSEAGAMTVSMQGNNNEEIYEPPPNVTVLWESTRVTGLFDINTDIKQVLDFLQSSLQVASLPPYHVERMENQDWLEKWMETIQPRCIGNRLWIFPTWLASSSNTGIQLILDPGLAFGTGSHPTTALCLEWLDQQDITGWEIIDYGCGSGILSIAAVKLGASHVWSLDIDNQALEATSRNANLNRVHQQISAIMPTRLPQHKVDCVIANILANPIIKLAPCFAELISSGGSIVLSGILISQISGVTTALEPYFDVDHVEEREKWVRISGTRR